MFIIPCLFRIRPSFEKTGLGLERGFMGTRKKRGCPYGSDLGGIMDYMSEWLPVVETFCWREGYGDNFRLSLASSG